MCLQKTDQSWEVKYIKTQKSKGVKTEYSKPYNFNLACESGNYSCSSVIFQNECSKYVKCQVFISLRHAVNFHCTAAIVW